MLCAGNFDLIAGIDSKAPGMLAVPIKGGGRDASYRERDRSQGNPFQSNSSFFREGATADGHPLLRTQKGRFLIGFQIEKASVFEALTLNGLIGKRIQLFLDDGGI
jgi:hypothetical protein